VIGCPFSAAAAPLTICAVWQIQLNRLIVACLRLENRDPVSPLLPISQFIEIEYCSMPVVL